MKLVGLTSYLMGAIWVGGVTGCGVKGPPLPYVSSDDVSSDKKEQGPPSSSWKATDPNGGVPTQDDKGKKRP
jgi:predicted small lipoprotein YifL